MSFSESRQTFMPSMMQSYVPGSDAISICPQFSTENDDQTLDFDSNPLPFKRARNSDSEERHTPSANRMIPANAPTNRGMNNIFWKTRLCAKFKMGLCRNGENCNFAHGVEDMRQPPPNWQDLVGLREEDHRPSANNSNNWDDDQRIIHRMKLCKKFYNGEDCPYGERCNFLHEDPTRYREDSGRLRESSVICSGPTVAASVSTTAVVQVSVGVSVNGGDDNKVASSNVNGSDPLRGIAKPSYWRTRLCNKWEQTGHCPFGDKCHFAHGFPELQASSGRESEVPGVGFATNYQLSANDYAVTNAGAFSEEARANKRCLLRWKGLEKINRIYGDWLDDLPLAHNVPSRVES